MSPEPFAPTEPTAPTDPAVSLWVHDERPSCCDYLRTLVGDIVDVARDMWSAWR